MRLDLALVLGTMLLVGCGSDDDTPGDTGDAGPSAAGTGGSPSQTAGGAPGVALPETPAACADEPAISDLSFVTGDQAVNLPDLQLVGCFSVTATEMLGDCTVQGGDADYWSQLPNGIYLMLGYADPDTPYAYAYTMGLSGGTAYPVPMSTDMPDYLRRAARCSAGVWATDSACECAGCNDTGPQTFHIQVYYYGEILESSCAQDLPDGASCTFNFNCTSSRCSNNVCGGGGSGGTGDACSQCLEACRGVDGCCTGYGCMCYEDCTLGQPCEPGTELCCNSLGDCMCMANCPF